MTIRANVTSVDAIKTFRSNLIVYAGKARPTVEEVNSEITRTRVWLETEQRVHWEAEVRRRTRKLEEAKQALFSSRLSKMREVSSAEQMAVTRAKNALAEAEGKLQMVKQWGRDYENRTEPLARQLEKMHTLLAHDLPGAISFLTKTIDTLEKYAGMIAPTASVDAGQPAAAPSAMDPSRLEEAAASPANETEAKIEPEGGS